MNKIFCVYLTMYAGTKLPKWYIGSSNLDKVNKGYNGSVVSVKWREIYKLEQKENKQLFKTRIISTHKTREEALIEELRVQHLHSVVHNRRYYNESYAIPNGFFGRTVKGKDHHSFGKPNTEEQKIKRKISMSIIESNGKTVIENTGIKISKTMKSDEWKETIGNELLLNKLNIGEDGLNHFQRMSIKGNETLKSEEWVENKKPLWVEKLKTTRNEIQENGKTFQYNVVQKSTQTKIKNSPHYNVYNNFGVMIEGNVSRKFVRENYTDVLRFKTRDNPVSGNNSKYKGYYCELITPLTPF